MPAGVGSWEVHAADWLARVPAANRPSQAMPAAIRVAADTLILLAAALTAQMFCTALGDAGAAGFAPTYVGEILVRRADLVSTAALVVIGVAVFHWNGFYNSGHLYRSKYKLVVVTEAAAVGFLISAAISLSLPAVLSLPPRVLLPTWVLAWAGLVLSRVWSSLWRSVIAQEASATKPRPSPTGERRRLLVIGGGGYIGSALLPKLLARGWEVRVLDVLMYGAGPIADALRHPACELVRADFRQVDKLVEAMRGVDAVVHLGGLVGDPACELDEELTIDINLVATRTIGAVAKGAGVRTFFYASTCSVYGISDGFVDERSRPEPVSLYARTKIASEKMLLDMADANFCPVVGRFATIHGISGRTRFDLVVNLLTAKALIDGEITVHGGDQWRPFVHVDDAARAIVLLLSQPLPQGERLVLNIGSNAENYTIARIGELVHKHVPRAKLIYGTSGGDVRDYKVDFGKMARLVGFRTTRTVDDGIREVARLIGAGKIRDYQDAAYSNVAFLRQFGSAHLERPRPRWAQELIEGQAAATMLCPPAMRSAGCLGSVA